MWWSSVVVEGDDLIAIGERFEIPVETLKALNKLTSDGLGAINDLWFSWVIDMGKPGPDRGLGGKYLIVGPRYDGPLPKGGYFVAQAKTDTILYVLRAFIKDGKDPKPAVENIKENLKRVRLSRAAVTSSAVPVVLSPVTLNDYGGRCGYQYPAWVKAVADPKTRARPAGRAYQRYVEMKLFQNSQHRPCIHLVDGGVADNIGVRGVLETLEELEASAALQNEVGCGVAQRIVVMVVNSHSSPSTDWDRRESPPGFAAQLMQSAGVPIDRYSFETVETMKDRAAIWGWRRELLVERARLAGATEGQAQASVPKVDLKVLDSEFGELADPFSLALQHNDTTNERYP